jgi:hypothetical protein
MNKDESEEGVTVATFANSFEAEIACGALHAAGIPAEIPLETAHLKNPFAAGRYVEIRVFERDREEALKILRRAGHK